MFKDYYDLTKPGIIFGNIITATGGFFLASNISNFQAIKFIAVMVGMACIIASGCIINNFIDYDIDQIMSRTKNRPTARGIIPLPIGIIYSATLAVVGVILLYTITNNLTVIIALFGLFIYVVIYSLWLKRSSQLGTIIGGISGAIPPIVGYCAVTNYFDTGAIILFLILFFWQLPHFWAISIFRIEDYTKANIPVLPIKKGIRYTQISMLILILIFSVIVSLTTLLGYTGWVYLILTLSINLYWLITGIKGFKIHSQLVWARKMFFISIIVITIVSLLMIIKY